MAINFPSSPTNGQTFQDPTSRNTYEYSSTYNVWLARRQSAATQTLTDGATINWDLSQGSLATVTLGGNRALAAPTNLYIGTHILTIIQDNSGNRTLTFDSIYKFPGGVDPVLTTTGNAKDIIFFYCDGTHMFGSFLPDVK
jgi:hypothetical protein